MAKRKLTIDEVKGKLLEIAGKKAIKYTQKIMEEHPAIFSELLKTDPQRFLDVDASKISSKKTAEFVNLAMEGYKINKGNLEEFMGSLNAKLRKHEAVIAAAINTDPTFYNHSNADKTIKEVLNTDVREILKNRKDIRAQGYKTQKSTELLSTLIAEGKADAELFSDVPQGLRSQKVVDNFLSVNPVGTFSKLNKKDSNNEHYIKSAIDSVNKEPNVDKVRDLFLKKINPKYIEKYKENLVDQNPLLLYKNTYEFEKGEDGKLNYYDEDGNKTDKKHGTPKKITLAEKEFIIDDFKNNQGLILRAFDNAKDSNLLDNFIFQMPKDVACLRHETLISMIDKCPEEKLKSFIGNLCLTERVDVQNRHLAPLRLSELMLHAVGKDPTVLEADEELTKTVLESRLGKKIYFKAISQDPTMLKFGTKPLNNRQINALIESSVRGMSNPKFDDNKRSLCSKCFEYILGMSKDESLILGKDDVTGNFANLKLSRKQQKHAFALLAQHNPKEILTLLSNEKLNDNKYLQRQYKKIVKTHPGLIEQFIKEQSAKSIVFEKQVKLEEEKCAKQRILAEQEKKSNEENSKVYQARLTKISKKVLTPEQKEKIESEQKERIERINKFIEVYELKSKEFSPENLDKIIEILKDGAKFAYQEQEKFCAKEYESYKSKNGDITFESFVKTKEGKDILTKFKKTEFGKTIDNVEKDIKIINDYNDAIENLKVSDKSQEELGSIAKETSETKQQKFYEKSKLNVDKLKKDKLNIETSVSKIIELSSKAPKKVKNAIKDFSSSNTMEP